MTLIDDIKRDRAAGTPGPFCCHFGDDAVRCNCRFVLAEYGGMGSIAEISVCEEMEASWGDDCGPPVNEAEANARRIARVPEMEARILSDAEALKAADEHLVKRLKALQTYFNLDEEELASLTKDERADTIRQHRLIFEALTAYRKARGARND